METYNYKGKNPVEVKVIQFYTCGDFILEKDEYRTEGGLKGLVKNGTVLLRNVERVIDGKMSQKAFKSLDAWE